MPAVSQPTLEELMAEIDPLAFQARKYMYNRSLFLFSDLVTLQFSEIRRFC